MIKTQHQARIGDTVQGQDFVTELVQVADGKDAEMLRLLDLTLDSMPQMPGGLGRVEVMARMVASIQWAVVESRNGIVGTNDVLDDQLDKLLALCYSWRRERLA